MKYSAITLRAYLTKHYTPVYRKTDCDFFYNFRNRRNMSIHLKKTFFFESEVGEIFDGKSELTGENELARFQEFINQPK